MPELPEVETIVNELRPLLVGRRIEGVAVSWPGALGGRDPAEFAARLVGREIGDVRRRAKYIQILLDGCDVLLVHLRMTGRLLLRPAEAPPDPYTRVVLALAGGEELRFTDVRKFGRLQLLSAAAAEQALAKIGPEPLAEGFAPADLARIFGRRRAPVKSALLDQTALAGLGNIYADEALFLAGIHPLRRADSLGEAEWRRLHAAIRQTLSEGIAHRGTTFRSYRDAQGRTGSHQDSLNVYRRTGQLCPCCGTAVERLVIGGRSSHFCPRCQT